MVEWERIARRPLTREAAEQNVRAEFESKSVSIVSANTSRKGAYPTAFSRFQLHNFLVINLSAASDQIEPHPPGILEAL